MRFGHRSGHNRDGEGNAVKRPKIEIAIRKNPEPASASGNPELRILGLVDSGADIPPIPRSVAEVIGLDTDDATAKTPRGASGECSTRRTKTQPETTMVGDAAPRHMPCAALRRPSVYPFDRDDLRSGLPQHPHPVTSAGTSL